MQLLLWKRELLSLGPSLVLVLPCFCSQLGGAAPAGDSQWHHHPQTQGPSQARSSPPSATCTPFCFHSFLDGLHSFLPLLQLWPFPVELFPRFLPCHSCTVDLVLSRTHLPWGTSSTPVAAISGDFRMKLSPTPALCPSCCGTRSACCSLGTGLLVCHPEWSFSEPSDPVTPMLHSPLGGPLGGAQGTRRKRLLHSLAPASGWTFLLPHSPPHCTFCFQDSLFACSPPAPSASLNPAEKLSKAQPSCPGREVTASATPGLSTSELGGHLHQVYGDLWGQVADERANQRLTLKHVIQGCERAWPCDWPAQQVPLLWTLGQPKRASRR